MTKVMRYNIEDFNKIISNGFEYTLSDELISIISELADKVGAPSYIKTPIFEKKDKKKKNLKLSDEEWDSIRKFKVTNLVKPTNFSNIRILLNKFSDENYDVKYYELNIELDNFINKNNEDKDENEIINLKKIANIMFEIFSTNSFYSKLYARLYCDLIKQYPIFLELLNESFKDFLVKLNDIKIINSDSDYDAFCENNLENEKKKALTLFYINLMKYEIISEYDIIELVDMLQDLIYKNIDIENMSSLIEEITEHLFIIIKNCTEELKESAAYTNINNRIEGIANYSVSNYHSLTNKIVFKHMDMLDILE